MLTVRRINIRTFLASVFLATIAVGVLYTFVPGNQHLLSPNDAPIITIFDFLEVMETSIGWPYYRYYVRLNELTLLGLLF